jgi:hypothetical protein
MDPLDFLAAVLPSSGRYCTFALNGKRNIFSTTREELYETTKRISAAGEEVWFALGSFDDSKNRKAENALLMRSFFMDLDCGNDVKTGKPRAFTTKKEAVMRLSNFLVASGLDALGAPWLIDSGGGVHPYWPLTEDITIAEWKPVAEALKNAAAKFSFDIDTTVTADAARVLRLPGTHNNKTAPRPVIIKHAGDIFAFDDIRALLEPYAVKIVKPAKTTALVIAGTAPQGPLSSVATALVNNSVTKFRTIMVKTEQGVGCGQLAAYMENPTEDGLEPVWRGLLSWTMPCVDGTKAAKIISAMHPYDEDRMHAKLREIKGPYACASMNTIQHGICERCPHWGKITNPLILGREFEVAQDPEPVVTHAELPPQPRPPLPRGFDYATNGGIIYHKPAEKKAEFSSDILVTAYDVFLSRVFRTSVGNHIAEFTTVKENVTSTFAIETKDITTDAKVISLLADNNIYTLYGAGHDVFLARYIRACVAERSGSERNIVNIPPRFGWQDNGDFAVGDMVYSHKGPAHDYSFNSANLNNIINATRSKGTLEEWRKPWGMMRRKGAWGHLAVAMAGFGSALQRFMPKGTNASAIHVCQDTSSGGKSLALNLQASIWGMPKQYFVVAKTSETTMMQRAGLLGGLPLLIDEITPLQQKTNGEWGPMFMFDYANGAHKIKGSHAGNTEISHEVLWDAIASLSSNSPMLEFMVGARRTTSHGEVRRFLEWAIPSGYELEMSEEETEDYNRIFTNHGVAGKKFAKWCVANQEEVQQICDTARLLWKKHSGATGKERFWTSNIASGIAACSICAKIELIDIPISHILDFWLGVVQRMRAIIDGSSVSAEDLLNRYIADNNGNFVRVDGNSVSQVLSLAGRARQDSTKGAVRGRIEYNIVPGQVDIYIEEKLMRVFCASVNRSYADFVTELESVKILKHARRDLLAGTNSPPLRTQCLHISRAIEPDDLPVTRALART